MEMIATIPAETVASEFSQQVSLQLEQTHKFDNDIYAYTNLITNMREYRLIEALYRHGEVSRHDLDELVGAENSPDVVFRMKSTGWELPCKRRKMIDRDGKTCMPGFYSLSEADRQAVEKNGWATTFNIMNTQEVS